MGNEIDDGGPVFSHMAADGHSDYRRGVSLRDYIAIHASDTDVESIAWGKWIDEAYVEMGRADRRYAFADAMLAARRG